MIILDTWDWHYRVGFNEVLRQQVADSIRSLPFKRHQDILTRQLETFAEIISVAQLVSFICDEEGDIQSAIDSVNDKKLLYLPDFLERKYSEKIASSNKLSQQQKKDLLKILESAVNTKFNNLHRDLFEPIFGENILTDLLSKSVNSIEPSIIDRPIVNEDLLVLTQRILADLKTRTPARVRSLANAIPNFQIKIVSDVGFAEYWPTSLTHAEQNELIVYNNKDQLGYENLRATLAHEIIGHSTFYELAERAKLPFFDHGANSFIEGWATWCEWTASIQPLAKHLRSARCQALSLLFNTDPNVIQQQITDNVSKLGYSHNVAESSIEYYFQYPGFSQSYTLGALWFEDRLRRQDPMDFLESINNQPWGDFFALW